MEPMPLRIGISSRLMHKPPAELGFRGKTLLYLEESIAHWVMAHGAIALMLPTISAQAGIPRSEVSIRTYVAQMDGLLLQGGTDVSPSSYNQAPIRPEWQGDRIRDLYELELIEGFLEAGKPILGICRGHQLINVAFGGTLVQDIATQRPNSISHVDAELYDEWEHDISLGEGTRLSDLYDRAPGGKVCSIHHQAVDRLGGDLEVEACSRDDGIVEAIRMRGSMFVAGVQWHPEFHWRRPGLMDAAPLMRAFLSAARGQRSQRVASI